jgi:hypothetical protein
MKKARPVTTGRAFFYAINLLVADVHGNFETKTNVFILRLLPHDDFSSKVAVKIKVKHSRKSPTSLVIALPVPCDRILNCNNYIIFFKKLPMSQV